MNRHYCTFEDRPDALIGVKLLALSLEKHCRDFKFSIILRDTPVGFPGWLANNAPNALLLVYEPKQDTWNIKAEIISHLLNQASEEVIWLDSDILVLRNLEELWARSGKDIVVAQEFDYGARVTAAQIAVFGSRLTVTLPHAINSCVLKFDRSQLGLLSEWTYLMSTDSYKAEQRKPFDRRRPGLKSDQEVLEYILSSHSSVSGTFVSYAATGVDIIQDHGSTTYALRHRLLNMLGRRRPYFVHALGEKPWSKNYNRKDSIYVQYAMAYRAYWEGRLSTTPTDEYIYNTFPTLSPHLRGVFRCLSGKIWRYFSTGSLQRKRV